MRGLSLPGSKRQSLVGARIVAEVIVGLIKGDRQSYLRQDPDWTPTYGTGDSFTMVDLLTTAGVVATIP
jgi:hypothetical protein